VPLIVTQLALALQDEVVAALVPEPSLDQKYQPLVDVSAVRAVRGSRSQCELR